MSDPISNTTGPLPLEARAGEVARLMQQTIPREQWDHFQRLAKADHDMQAAEIERLRAALQSIWDMPGDRLDEAWITCRDALGAESHG